MEAVQQHIGNLAPNSNYWRDRLQQHMTENNINQAQMAQALGFTTPSGLNQYLKGTYKSPAAMERKLQEYFSISEAADRLHVEPDYAPTSISEAVYATIRQAHLKGGLAIECGDAGIGKTKGVRKYLADYPNNAVLITVNPAFVSISSFLKLLCRTLHIAEGRRDDMWLNVASYFAGSRKVLIIDEAQHLPVKTIELIRALADYVPSMGVVFVGNRAVADNMGGRLEAAFAQITSRTKARKIRLTTQITAEDIRLLFPNLAGEREHALLLAIAQSKQGIRGAANLYSNACDNEDTSYDGLILMAKYMEMAI